MRLQQFQKIKSFISLYHNKHPNEDKDDDSDEKENKNDQIKEIKYPSNYYEWQISPLSLTKESVSDKFEMLSI